MFFYWSAISSSAVLSRGGGREVPFDVGCPGDERDVIQVNYLR